MRTYFISTSAFGKAIPNYFFELTKAIVSLGNKVIVIFDGEHNQHGSERNLIYVTWPSKRPNKVKDFIFYFNLCIEHKPDVIIGQFGSTNITLIVGKILKVPNRIIYWHTMFLQHKIDSKRSKTMLKFKFLTQKWLFRYCATLIMTNSSATKKDLFSKYKIHNIRVFNYLIPDPIHQNKIKKKNEREYTITFVGRLDKSKGQELIIDEIPDVLKRFPSLKFIFIGEGTEKKRLIEKCNNLQISKSVTFAGTMNLDSVYKNLEKSLIHISASVEEAFGLVNAEAISVGTPILANKVGGIVDILNNKKNGLFLDLNKKGDLKMKIEQIIEDNWAFYSKNSRESFLKRFNANQENINNQVGRLLKEIR